MRYGLEDSIEKHRAALAAQTPDYLSTAAGVHSWHDIALAAIERGDEDFAVELVGLVERQLRQMS